MFPHFINFLKSCETAPAHIELRKATILTGAESHRRRAPPDPPKRVARIQRGTAVYTVGASRYGQPAPSGPLEPRPDPTINLVKEQFSLEKNPALLDEWPFPVLPGRNQEKKLSQMITNGRSHSRHRWVSHPTTSPFFSQMRLESFQRLTEISSCLIPSVITGSSVFRDERFHHEYRIELTHSPADGSVINEMNAQRGFFCSRRKVLIRSLKSLQVMENEFCSFIVYT